MGYSTRFEGTLKFAHKITVEELQALQGILGEDCRDHPEWGQQAQGLYYIDLELTKDFSGLKWNEAEKAYDMVQIVNLVTTLLRKVNPEFRLTGALKASGDDAGDIWQLTMTEAGVAIEEKLVAVGIVTCPSCEHRFKPGDGES